ncbi:MmgE/PrpD family protein [Marinobacter oulmenensis]|uniref:2-methylcitrate dehydratase PrpD n=1 Tax=Marinobacter oulmenensis TaxID=643747 RepID=A0A840U258_9GAMM|nr:MmgE/PrpD family protein [Marinobacter oulmenensis]MBB5319764.1 2-methylcitrate dehydratase PrpD [Marinobacter oulmenensis]
MTLAQHFAHFIKGLRLEHIPEEVINKARTCVLNGYGIALGSHTTAFAPVAGKAVLAMDGERECGATLLSDGRRTTTAGATLANAALFHGRAQEDTCGVAHFGAVLLPLLTGLLEEGNGVIEDFLPALIAGYEIGGALESAYSPITTAAGLRASPLYGSVAAAAAVSRLWNLSVEQTTSALANAASFTGGILQSFGDGTDEWRYQVGMAGRNGLASAWLARAGSVSAVNAFEGRSGFIQAFVRQAPDVDAIAEKLGKDWSVLKVTFKPHPVCALNQTPVSAAIELRDRLDGRRIEAVRVYLNPTVVGYAGMDTEGPFHSVSGTLMSIQFCVATTLLYGTPTIARMGHFDDPGVSHLIPRVKPLADPDMGLLSCRIEADVEGESICIDRRVDHTEYAYDRKQVSELVRRIGEETGVPPAAYDRLEKFTNELPYADLNDVFAAFKNIQKAG